jgi:hypothetical protein
MKKIIRKYWKDSVWSKIIAVGILGLISIIYNLIKSYFKSTDFLTEFNKFWNIKISLWFIMLAVFILYGIYLAIKLLRKKSSEYIYDQETLELDKKLFDRIRNDLLDEDTYLNLKENVFSSNNFLSTKLNFAYLIIQENKKPQFEFLHPELEILKNELVESLDIFEKSTFGNLFTFNSQGYIGIPKEWEYDRFYEAVEKISTEERNVCIKFDELIKKGRRLLKT